jgi:hypothetical protein
MTARTSGKSLPMSVEGAEQNDHKRMLRRLTEDLPLYAEHILRIRNKVGALSALRLNRAQKALHEAAERQRDEAGMVRIIGLKGRQQGFSTYVGARFYQKTSTHFGQRARVIAHTQDSTDDLFGMVKRFHDNNAIAPHKGKSNEKELVFDLLDSGYKVATAGSEDIGRGGTAQLLHGSEVAFWKNLSSHLAGIGNIVADLPGTEIFLESTANGQGNGFHQLWLAAEAGEVPYRPVFVPWFWQPEYAAEPGKDFALSPEDREYQRTYNLTLSQMAWRAAKISTYEAGYEWLFDQEYPASPTVAFVSTNRNPLISPAAVEAAMRSVYATMEGPLVIGCDPAGEGESADRTVIAFRRGRIAYKFLRLVGLNTMQIAGRLAKIWEEERPDALFVDQGGLGAGIVDRLRELNVPVIGVNASGAPTGLHGPELFLNKRAEMWWAMRDWINDKPVRIVREPELASDLVAPGIAPPNSAGRRQLESKKDMKKRGVRSPDYGDALALTFAEPIVRSLSSPGAVASRYKPASAAGY